MIPELRIFGIGGAGCNCINQLAGVLPVEAEWIGLDSDIGCLARTLSTRKILLDDDAIKGRGAGGDVAVALRAWHRYEACLVEYLRRFPKRLNVAIGAVGGGTGSAVLVELSRIFSRLAMPEHVLLVIRPFSFEGMRRRENAMAALKELTDLPVNLLQFANDDLLSIDPLAPLHKILYQRDEEIGKIILSLVREHSVSLGTGNGESYDFVNGESALCAVLSVDAYSVPLGGLFFQAVLCTACRGKGTLKAFFFRRITCQKCRGYGWIKGE